MKNNSFRFLVLLIFIGTSNVFCQSGQESVSTKDSVLYKEKVYLHFDKPYYTTGDTIWFKAYVTDALSNHPIVLSKILYVDLIDPMGEIVSSRVLKIEEGAAGDFKLGTNLITGNYRVRAYTNYMRNFDEDYFFRKKIKISSLKSAETESIEIDLKNSDELTGNSVNVKPDLQFFPEGGNMITGISNRVGFKGIGVDGKGISVRGEIFDDGGVKIKTFNTAKFGMGLFDFTPLQGKNYTAKINFNGKNYTYVLPKAMDNGVAIQVRDLKEVFRINLESSLTEGIKELVIIGKQRNAVVCKLEIQETGLNATINIPKEYLEEGIVQFTVLDKDRIPLCERLVFVEKKDIEPKVSLVATKDTYKRRELVELNIEFSNQLAAVEQTNMSIAVTDVAVVEKEENGMNIKSHLLLNSELKGNIEQPSYYFESDDPQRKQMLDVLMLTQGWRRYLWSDSEKKALQKMSYKIEEGFTISGTVRKFYAKNKIALATVTLLTMNENTVNNFKQNTDDHGRFSFGPYVISDSITVILKANNLETNGEIEKKKSRKQEIDYAIDVDTKNPPEVKSVIKNPLISFGDDQTLETYRDNEDSLRITMENIRNRYNSRSRDRQINDSILKVEKGTIFLDEVSLEGEKENEMEVQLAEIKDKKRTALGKNPSHTIDFKELDFIPTNLLEALQGRVVGVSIQQQYDLSFKAYTSGYNSPNNMKILLDGMLIQDESVPFVDSSNIDFIDIVKPPRSYKYGANGHFGVIAIYTKDPESEILHEQRKLENEKKPEIARFVHPGYYQAKEFYSPIYTASSPKLEQPDFRSTIYWNPNVRLNKNGEGKILFYASNEPTTYRVALEGLTTNGIPVVKEFFIEIKK